MTYPSRSWCGGGYYFPIFLYCGCAHTSARTHTYTLVVLTFKKRRTLALHVGRRGSPMSVHLSGSLSFYFLPSLLAASSCLPPGHHPTPSAPVRSVVVVRRRASFSFKRTHTHTHAHLPWCCCYLLLLLAAASAALISSTLRPPPSHRSPLLLLVILRSSFFFFFCLLSHISHTPAPSAAF